MLPVSAMYCTELPVPLGSSIVVNECPLDRRERVSLEPEAVQSALKDSLIDEEHPEIDPQTPKGANAENES
jgi:hypothetical protein